MHVYYAANCPHSASILQLLGLLDVKFKTTDVSKGSPAQVRGTPAIVLDGEVYHGDHAFDLLDTLRAEPPQAVDEPSADDPVVREAQGIVDPSAVKNLFETNSVAPRQ